MFRTTYYIYPTYTPQRDTSGNLYIKYFHDSFSDEFTVLNKNGQLGIASIFFNLKADRFILQWIDLIPFKRLGYLQTLLFVISLSLLRLLKKDIIWVLHNKEPHNKTNKTKKQLATWCMEKIAKRSALVVTHSTEGITFLQHQYPDIPIAKFLYIPHPAYRNEIIPGSGIVWDYIIWGGISRHKNVAGFLAYVNQSNVLSERKILICGKCNDPDYQAEIEKHLTGNICFMNKFLEDQELEKQISRSRCILFTYNLDSVLSSGALIYSLNFNKLIIGPNGGAFADLRSIVDCYNSFEEIEKIDPDRPPNLSGIRSYIANNQWKDLPGKIDREINKVAG